MSQKLFSTLFKTSPLQIQRIKQRSQKDYIKYMVLQNYNFSSLSIMNKQKRKTQTMIYKNLTEQKTVPKVKVLWERFFLQKFMKPQNYSMKTGFKSQAGFLQSQLEIGLRTYQSFQIQQTEEDQPIQNLLNLFTNLQPNKFMQDENQLRLGQYSVAKQDLDYQNSYFLCHKFFCDKIQLQESSIFIIDIIFKQVVSLRILQSLINYENNNKEYPEQQSNFKWEKCYFDNNKKIVFKIDFQRYFGNITEWAADIDEFNIYLLQLIQNKFNVQFVFICSFNFHDEDIPKPYCAFLVQQQQSQSDSQPQTESSTLCSTWSQMDIQ